MNMRTLKANRVLVAAGILSVACLFGPQAQATFITTINQVGADVVVTGSGTINLTGLSFKGTTPDNAGIAPKFGVLQIGSSAGDQTDYYTGYSGPNNSFGPGDLTTANSGSGDKVGLNAGGPYLFVPSGYVSGTLLSDTSTYNSATLASLGITPGTYTWSWGSGPNADSFILNAGVASVPDAGSSLLLLLMATAPMLLATRARLKHLAAHCALSKPQRV